MIGACPPMLNRLLPAKPAPSAPPPLSLRLSDGRELPVVLRRHGRSRRLTARLDPLAEALRVTAPPGVRQTDIVNFIRQHRDWVERQLARGGGRIAIVPGLALPIEGIARVIEPTGQLRGLPRLEPDRLLVPGAPEHLQRRVFGFCRELARERIEWLAGDMADEIGATIKRIRLRDTISRWGSCTHDGMLSFSWRLIMAPPLILDYVVAHEVAHLRHMDHSPAFWALNRQLAQDDTATSRDWLRREGRGLMRFGA